MLGKEAGHQSHRHEMTLEAMVEQQTCRGGEIACLYLLYSQCYPSNMNDDGARDFRESAILSYIGRPPEYEPRPSSSPIEFLQKHLHLLPPHLIVGFSSITTPKQRSVIAAIRNRRLAYTETKPKQLAFAEARNRWPHLWSGRGRYGQEAAQEEREWAERGFLGGGAQQVGKLGTLLADYEEEREAERIRQVRRQRVTEEFVPEEEEDSDQGGMEVEESPEEEQAAFERRIKELFIYGMLEVRGVDGRWWWMTNLCRERTTSWWTGASSTTSTTSESKSSTLRTIQSDRRCDPGHPFLGIIRGRGLQNACCFLSLPSSSSLAHPKYMASLTSDIQRALQLAVGEANHPFIQSQSSNKKRTRNDEPAQDKKKKKKKSTKEPSNKDNDVAHPLPAEIDQQNISVDSHHASSAAFLNAVVAAASATSDVQPMEIPPYQTTPPYQDQQILPDQPSPYIQYTPVHYGFHDPSQFAQPPPQGHPIFPGLGAPLPDFNFASNDDIIRALQDMDVSKIASVLKSLGDAAAANVSVTNPPAFVPPSLPPLQANTIVRSQPQVDLPSTSTGPVLSSVPKSTKSSHKRVLDMSLPGPEQINPDHAHMLANKWMNASKLAELVKTQGRRFAPDDGLCFSISVQVLCTKKANFLR